MRTNKLAVAVVLAAAALSANAAGNHRMEPTNSPFTYEALGATPTLTFGRTQATAPKAAAAKTVEEAKPATAATGSSAATRAPSAAATPFTYDTIGATPHVQVKKATSTETLAPQPAR